MRFQNSDKSLLGILLLLLTMPGPVVQAQQNFPAEARKSNADLASASGAATLETNTENWSSPSLAGSYLRAVPPLLGEKEHSSSFTRELIRVEWRRNDPIYLYVILPNGAPHPPAILYLYSYPSDIDRFRDDDFCKLLTKDGFAAVGFVSALTGHRYHDRPMREWFVSELPESLAASAHDVQMILNYLATRGDVDMERIGMFGDGSGATIAILAAAVDPRIKALDLLDPWGDWPDWLAKSALVPKAERAAYLKPEFLGRIKPLDPIQWLPQLRSTKVRLQEAEYEKVTPKVAKKRLEAAVRSPAQLVRYKNGNAVAEAARGDRFFDWVKEQVQTTPAN